MSTTFHPVVLLVEDEPLIRICTGETLRDAGFGVIEASDADEAIPLIDHHPEVDILFSDINMPGAMDGLALAGRVSVSHPNVVLILTSGRGDPERRLPHDGGFVGKPYSTRAVAQLMTAMIAKR